MNDRLSPGSLVYSLIHAARVMEARLEASLEVQGLSLAKFTVLDHLSRNGSPMTLGELADKSGCVRSNITQLMDRLEAEGLVRRLPDPDDRRVTRAALTELGAEKQKAGAGALAVAQQAAMGSLPEGDRASLNWALRRLS